MLWKGEFLAYFKILFNNYPGGAEKKHETLLG
jgi:hypothetical protein